MHQSLKIAALAASVASMSSSVFAAQIHYAQNLPTATLGTTVSESLLSERSLGGFSPNVAGITTTIFDSNGFEPPAYAVGPLVGQNTWVGYSAATAGAVNVSTASPHIATQMARVAGGTVATPINVFTSPTHAPVVPLPGDIVAVNVDLARSVTTSSASSTTYYSVGSYDSLGNEVSEVGLTRRAASATSGVGLYVVAPFNTVTNQFAKGYPVFIVTVATGLSASNLYNLTQQLNYTTQTYDLYSGGSPFVTGIPFATQVGAAGTVTGPTSVDLSDADIQGISAKGVDFGAFDSYSVSVVPEPATLSAVAGIALTLVRRRR